MDGIELIAIFFGAYAFVMLCLLDPSDGDY